MKAPELPDNEPTRIAQLHELHILDTELESVFDNITELVADTLNMPIVAVSLIAVSYTHLTLPTNREV